MSRRARRHADIEPNLTSLIDVTFLLIVFFVLVSHLNEMEIVEMDLPHPSNPATMPPEGENQVAVSVMPAPDGKAAGYRVGEQSFDADKNGLDLLEANLAALYRARPQISINIRADRATNYEYVEPAIHAVSTAARAARAAGVDVANPRVNLMVLKD